MKKALLVVSFGTSVAQAGKSIRAVEDALKNAAERDFYRAFTSPTIRRILSRRGETVPGLEDALETLLAGGYTDVFVQPTHLLYGFEYDSMKALLAQAAPRFEKLALGLPLLAGAEDLTALADCLKTAYLPEAPEAALVLLGHGTEHFANMVYPAMQTALRLCGAENAFVGTVEGWPGFDEVLAQLKAGGYKRAVIVPMMLVAGDHACRDMAGAEPDSWKSRLEDAEIEVSCVLRGLGELPGVQAVYVDHLRRLLA